MYRFFPTLLLIGAVTLAGCDKEKDQVEDQPTPANGPKLVFKFAFDPNQIRLNSFGNEADVAVGNGAQSPDFNFMSAHYVELIPNEFTQIGDGEVLFIGPETNAGGALALDFDQAVLVTEGETFLSIPLDNIAAGTYPHLRVSLAYQNYNVNYWFNSMEYTGTLASFIGYNTYINSYLVNEQSVTVNDDKLQGYWGFETLGNVTSGQVPPGATTVVNPFFATAPIPVGSCLVTGSFLQELVITGNETEDIIITVSLSVNNSFEWNEVVADNKWEPLIGENVVDMGIRGMIPTWE